MTTAADHARDLTASAMKLADDLLDDLSGRSGFSLDADVRGILRDDWIALVATHLVDHHGDLTPDPRFPRPVACAWCGNRHRAITPFSEDLTQGDGCAASVFQVTEEILARTETAERQDPAASAGTLAIGDWLVNGHYGSTAHDCALFRFIRNLPTSAADPVCDNCVGERISAGDLERIEGNYP